MHHAAVAGGNARPLVDAFPEHLRTTDEVARMPIGQRDLALGRRGVISANAAGLDHENAVLARAKARKPAAPVNDTATLRRDRGIKLFGPSRLARVQGRP